MTPDLITTVLSLTRLATLALWAPLIALGVSAIAGLCYTFWPRRRAGLWT